MEERREREMVELEHLRKLGVEATHKWAEAKKGLPPSIVFTIPSQEVDKKKKCF